MIISSLMEGESVMGNKRRVSGSQINQEALRGRMFQEERSELSEAQR